MEENENENSFVSEFREIIESGKIVLTLPQKDFLRQVFPNKDFSKKGCKSCWADAIMEYLNKMKHAQNIKPMPISEGDILVIDAEKYGYSYMGVDYQGKRVFICKDVAEVHKRVKRFDCYDELSFFAQEFFKNNTQIHRYLMKKE